MPDWLWLAALVLNVPFSLWLSVRLVEWDNRRWRRRNGLGH